MKVAPPRESPPALVDLETTGPEAALNTEGTDGLRIEDAVLDGVTRRGVSYRETEFIRACASRAAFNNCRFLDVRFDGLDAPDLEASRSTLRDVEIAHSRLGSMDLYGSTVSGVRLSHCKIRLLGLHSAQVQDLIVEHCTIDELDLSEAVAARLAFRDATIGLLRLRDSRMSHVDLRTCRFDGADPIAGLRGCLITGAQLLDLAPSLASALGILVD